VRGLVSGQRPLEIAGSQAVSVHTIRTHLKRAMFKAGVHSQAALVSRVFSIEK
jgi:DNA-binding CsgD family transcriptional regulator